MSKSIRSAKQKKPAQPYADFPLFARATRRWARKIKGKPRYFGPWDDPDGALQKYLDQRDDLHPGRAPRGYGGQTLFFVSCGDRTGRARWQETINKV